MELTKERLEEIHAEYSRPNHSKSFSVKDSEIAEMARQLLVGLEQEPVAWRWFHLKQWHVTNDEARARNLAWDGVNITPLYTAPQLPQPAVPDIATVETTYPDVQTNWQDAKMYAEGWNACRAAMLQGAEPVQAWIPCSERMPDGMQTVITSNGFDIGHGWWDGDAWQEWSRHDAVPGEVTHWMPLPAAPQQEAKSGR